MSEKIALVVDDTPANRDFLERLLTQAGFVIHGASDGKQALALMDKLDQIDLAMIDIELPDIPGLQLTYDLRKRHDETYIVVATMHDERSLMESVFSKGGDCFLVKPHGFMELYRRLTTKSLTELRDGDPVIINQYGVQEFKTALR